MAEWRDVMEARSLASEAVGRAVASAEGSGDPGESAAAVVYGITAICCELRALGTMIDYAVGELGAHVGRS